MSGYYGTIVRRFSGQIFSDEHKYSPYYVSGLAYYRIEQFFRSGDLKTELKKARFHLIYLARLLAIGEHLDPFNSNKFDKSCEQFKDRLIDEKKLLKFLLPHKRYLKNRVSIKIRNSINLRVKLRCFSIRTESITSQCSRPLKRQLIETLTPKKIIPSQLLKKQKIRH